MQQGVQDRFCFSYHPRCIEFTKDLMGARISRDSCMRYRRQRSLGSVQLATMSKSEEEPQLLGSRRIARLFLSLGIDFFRDDNQARLFGSRRLALLANLKPFNASRAAETQIPIEPIDSKEQTLKGSTPPDSKTDESHPGIQKREISSDGTRPDTLRTHSLPGPRRPSLPQLSETELSLLLKGERIEKQARNGRVGNGLVVVDVNAEPATVFAVLADISRSVGLLPNPT